MKVYIIGFNEPPKYNGMGKLVNKQAMITVVCVDGEPALFSAREAAQEIEECSQDVPDLDWSFVWKHSVPLKDIEKECGL